MLIALLIVLSTAVDARHFAFLKIATAHPFVPCLIINKLVVPLVTDREK